MSEDNTDFRTPTWWNNRVKERQHDLKNLIFNDDFREQFWERTDKLLASFSDYSVADIGCGYGRFAKHFETYMGIDFCEEMLKLATEQNPNKNFIKGKCLDPLPNKVDMVFEVNCLHSFGVSREQFFEHYKQYARKAVICIERNGVDIYWIYEKKDNR